MIRATEVKARAGRRIWLRYSDGAAGEVDLSHLEGRGVFAAWNDADRFRAVRITAHGAIAWGGDLELCPDALYMALTGRSIEEIMSGARALAENA